MRIVRHIISTGLVGVWAAAATTAWAQDPASVALLRSRYQVTQMERVLGGARSMAPRSRVSGCAR